MVRKAREIECNYRALAVGGLREEIINLGKDM